MAEQQASGQPRQQSQAPSTSGLAIAGLVLGILALITSFMPIVNNGSFVIGIIGLVLAIVGHSQTRKGAKTGSGLAIAGIVLNIAAIAVTLAVQAACSAALDSITSGPTGTVASEPASVETESGAGQAQTDTSNLAVGQTVDLSDGLSVTVNSVETGLVNFDGSTVTGITVTYVNNGKSGASFNMLDWKAEDASGAQRTMTYYSNSENDLNSGTLSAGGSVTGNLYFDEPVVKVYYYSSILSSSSDIAWNIA